MSLSVDQPEHAERQFKSFAEGGSVAMPISETSGALRFGLPTDRYGAQWMVNCIRPG